MARGWILTTGDGPRTSRVGVLVGAAVLFTDDDLEEVGADGQANAVATDREVCLAPNLGLQAEMLRGAVGVRAQFDAMWYRETVVGSRTNQMPLSATVSLLVRSRHASVE